MKLPKSNFIKLMLNKAGKPPGEIVTTGEEAAETTISFLRFNDKIYERQQIENIAEIAGMISPDTTNWLHVSGFRDSEVFRQIGEQFNIGSLVIEDALNQEHLPKSEETEDQIFMIMKEISRRDIGSEYVVNHLTFILQKNLLISFARYPTPVFDGFIDRIYQAVKKIRQRKEDYLFYRLMDIVTDQYFLVFEALENELFEMEEQIGVDELEHPAEKITSTKKHIFYLKKFLHPTSEAINSILKSETALIKKQNRGFYADVVDHLRHMLQNLDGYRETAISLMEMHMSNNAHRMNEVMKTLTVIATIFIPLTFLAGIYGMNFQYMPELAYRWAYPVLLGIMFILGMGMFLYMKSKKWF